MSEDSRPIRELLRQARVGEGGALQHLLEQYREYIRLVVRCRSRGQLQARLEASASNAGGLLEGPLGKKQRGSWIVSFRMALWIADCLF